MNDTLSRLSRADIQDFIVAHEHDDVRELVLRHKEIHGVPASWMATQIAGRKKAKNKLPLWHSTTGIIYPSAINLEQSSSEATARYKSNLTEGHEAVDLTGGFGVDSYFLSKKFRHLDYVEPDKDLLSVARHNHQLLGIKNIRYHHMTAQDFLGTLSGKKDLLFADPSRRAGSRKVINLTGSVPDVVNLKSILVEHSHELLIKASPLLDLQQAARELPGIYRLVVVAHENECKELLLFVRAGSPTAEPEIRAVSIDPNHESYEFRFTWVQEKNALVKYGDLAKYLYEPSSALMKAGAFRLISKQFGVKKLASATHLYTSEAFVKAFPGRVFEVIRPVKLENKVRDYFDNGQANILIRNYPMSVPEIKKKTGLKEGGAEYLICFRAKRPMAVIAKRLK